MAIILDAASIIRLSTRCGDPDAHLCRPPMPVTTLCLDIFYAFTCVVTKLIAMTGCQTLRVATGLKRIQHKRDDYDAILSVFVGPFRRPRHAIG